MSGRKHISVENFKISLHHDEVHDYTWIEFATLDLSHSGVWADVKFEDGDVSGHASHSMDADPETLRELAAQLTEMANAVEKIQDDKA